VLSPVADVATMNATAASKADQVRAIFDLYLKERSLLRCVELLNGRGWRTKSWTTNKGTLHDGAAGTRRVCGGSSGAPPTSPRSATRARSTRGSTPASDRGAPGEIQRGLVGRQAEVDPDQAAKALAACDPVWDALVPREQANLLQLLIERVDYDGQVKEVAITFRPSGLASLAGEQRSAASARSGTPST
jgi:hypothetical protein